MEASAAAVMPWFGWRPSLVFLLAVQASLPLSSCATTVQGSAPVGATESNCSATFQIPRKVPDLAVEYNGVHLPDVCISKPGPYHAYAIGDWGGLVFGKNMPPIPADKRSKLFPLFHRKYVGGIDDRAQLLTAAQMRARGTVAPPDYFLNAGDNFYWGGVEGTCGSPPMTDRFSYQWNVVFEMAYWGTVFEDKPWLGVLGNHDFGGFTFTSAWEQIIGYTWASRKRDGAAGRWLTPGLYWSQKVRYPSFSVTYLFVDTNSAEAWLPEFNQDHNICGLNHTKEGATCGKQGPQDLRSCHGWFKNIWEEQWLWLHDTLEKALTSTFQIVVTHFPAKWFKDSWNCLAARYGIDLHVSGHIHHQRVYSGSNKENFISGGTCSIITGGGGGITSEGIPSKNGFDDQYGFFDLQLASENIKVTGISHGGVVRSVTTCGIRQPKPGPRCPKSFDSGRRLQEEELLPREAQTKHPTFV